MPRSIGKHLKAVRELRGLTICQAAAIIKVSNLEITRIENDDKWTESIEKYANLLNVNLTEWYPTTLSTDIKSYPPSADAVENFLRDREKIKHERDPVAKVKARSDLEIRTLRAERLATEALLDAATARAERAEAEIARQSAEAETKVARQREDAATARAERAEAEIARQSAEAETARQRAEAEIARQYAKAEREMREAIEKTRDEQVALFGGVAHDLKTRQEAFSALSLRIQQMLDYPEDLSARDYFEKLNPWLDDMICERDYFSLLTSNLYDIASSSDSTVKIAFSNVDIAKLLEDSARLGKTISTKHEIECNDVKCDAKFKTDHGIITRVIANLIINAQRHGNTNNPGTIMLDATVLEKTLIIRVIDSGPGIPRELSFEELCQRPTRGLGIIHKHISILKGSLSYERLPNSTVFEVRIPEAT